MKYRNAKYMDDGSIDCEIEHPKLGWIPFLCRVGDSGAQFDVDALHAEMVASGSVEAYVAPPPPPVSVANVNAECDRRIWAFLGVGDKVAALAKQQSYANFIQSMQIKLADGVGLSVEEDARRTAILAGYAHVEAIVAASNVLSAMGPIPADYASDGYWPIVPV